MSSRGSGFPASSQFEAGAIGGDDCRDPKSFVTPEWPTMEADVGTAGRDPHEVYDTFSSENRAEIVTTTWHNLANPGCRTWCSCKNYRFSRLVPFWRTKRWDSSCGAWDGKLWLRHWLDRGSAINSRSRLRRSRKYWPTSWERRAPRHDSVSPDNKLHFGFIFEGQLLIFYLRAQSVQDEIRWWTGVSWFLYRTTGWILVVTWLWQRNYHRSSVRSTPSVASTRSRASSYGWIKLPNFSMWIAHERRLPWHVRRGIQTICTNFDDGRHSHAPARDKSESECHRSSRAEATEKRWVDVFGKPTCTNQLGNWNVRTSADEGFLFLVHVVMHPTSTVV